MPKMPTFLVTENANEKSRKNLVLDHNRKNGKKW